MAGQWVAPALRRHYCPAGGAGGRSVAAIVVLAMRCASMKRVALIAFGLSLAWAAGCTTEESGINLAPGGSGGDGGGGSGGGGSGGGGSGGRDASVVDAPGAGGTGGSGHCNPALDRALGASCGCND